MPRGKLNATQKEKQKEKRREKRRAPYNNQPSSSRKVIFRSHEQSPEDSNSSKLQVCTKEQDSTSQDSSQSKPNAINVDARKTVDTDVDPEETSIQDSLQIIGDEFDSLGNLIE